MVELADYRGARGSNAGDEFHELWALEQVLGLLAPNTQLRAVKVEGVRTGRSGVDTNEPFWDSVDCSLYFGGDTSSRLPTLSTLFSSSTPVIRFAPSRSLALPPTLPRPGPTPSCASLRTTTDTLANG